MVKRDSCLARIGAGVAIGGSVGAAAGVVFGTFEAFRHKIPGALKIRHIGQTTLASAGMFGLFLGVGSILHCGK
ncbi:Reactive oxygen species modulator 1-like [Thalictrum thalictroides]|uniref:Reactive oxygen species modulator 1-like n=1 Tax=Thalictrum thalictroides TaxID=46969 RepID=A0A7J6VLP8_THATH|nr:Reactive oxygen species modulator 1-like [Thalictrum thalictroides]